MTRGRDGRAATPSVRARPAGVRAALLGSAVAWAGAAVGGCGDVRDHFVCRVCYADDPGRCAEEASIMSASVARHDAAVQLCHQGAVPPAHAEACARYRQRAAPTPVPAPLPSAHFGSHPCRVERRRLPPRLGGH